MGIWQLQSAEALRNSQHDNGTAQQLSLCVFVFVCDGIMNLSLDVLSMWKDHLQLGWTLGTERPGRMSKINHVCLNEEPRSKVTFWERLLLNVTSKCSVWCETVCVFKIPMSLAFRGNSRGKWYNNVGNYTQFTHRWPNSIEMMCNWYMIKMNWCVFCQTALNIDMKRFDLLPNVMAVWAIEL